MASDTNAKAAMKSSCCGGGGTGAAAGLRPPEQGLNCPRCDSLNTKFCYYNNYSLTQPRHFCKSCRRYWTKGGALRNVPVGGGCRKNRKSKSSSNLSVSSSSSSSQIHPSLTTESSKAFAQTASTDFHLNSFFPFSIAAINTTASMSAEKTIGGYNSIASSIESLSSINQDLHWRLQQQRMQLLFEGQQPQHKDPGIVSFTHNQVEPSSFAMAENNKGEIFIDTPPPNGTHKSSDTGTAWFLDGAFALPPPPSAINAHGSINIGASATDWNGIAASWSDVQHFTSLP